MNQLGLNTFVQKWDVVETWCLSLNPVMKLDASKFMLEIMGCALVFLVQKSEGGWRPGGGPTLRLHFPLPQHLVFCPDRHYGSYFHYYNDQLTQPKLLLNINSSSVVMLLWLGDAFVSLVYAHGTIWQLFKKIFLLTSSSRCLFLFVMQKSYI